MAKEAAKESKAVSVQKDELSQSAIAMRADAEIRAMELQELGVEAADLVIPSIQVMQNTSSLVGDGKAKLGDIVNMQTEEVIGGEKPVKILPLRMYKTLRTYDVTDNGFKFMFEDPLTPQNDKLDGEGQIDGRPVKRYHTFNFFVLLKTDLEKGEGFPCLLRFRSTGMHAGRALATHLYKLVFFRKKPYSEFVEITSKKEKKGTATYAVPVIDVKKTTAASTTEITEAQNWLAMLAAGNYRVADREEKEDLSEDASVRAAKPVVVDAEVVGKESGDY